MGILFKSTEKFSGGFRVLIYLFNASIRLLLALMKWTAMFMKRWH